MIAFFGAVRDSSLSVGLLISSMPIFIGVDVLVPKFLYSSAMLYFGFQHSGGCHDRKSVGF